MVTTLKKGFEKWNIIESKMQEVDRSTLFQFKKAINREIKKTMV